MSSHTARVLSSQLGTYQTRRTIFWSRLSMESPLNLSKLGPLHSAAEGVYFEDEWTLARNNVLLQNFK